MGSLGYLVGTFAVYDKLYGFLFSPLVTVDLLNLIFDLKNEEIPNAISIILSLDLSVKETVESLEIYILGPIEYRD